MRLTQAAVLALLAILFAAFATACDETEPEVVVTVTPAVSGTVAATSTSTAAATSTPSSTATAAATGTSAPGAPAGYSTSCAAGYPWGETVDGPFICIEAPPSGTTLGSSVELSGFAGGSFENNVVIEIRDENNVPLAQQALTYESPNIGTPGAWEVTLPVPPGQLADAPGRIVAFFESPRDGGVVALDSIEVRFP